MPVRSANKLFFHAQRLRSGIRDWRTPPINLDMDLTNKCDSRCPNCSYLDQKHLPRRYLPLELAKQIVAQAAAFGVKAITYGGDGEPVPHNGLGDLMEFSTEAGLQNGLVSNGASFTVGKAERMLPHLKWVRFSLDAGSPAVYQVSHGLAGKSFSRVVSNIETAVSTKVRSDLSARIGISYLFFQADPRDFEMAAKIAAGLGVDYIQFKPMRMFDESAVGGRSFDVVRLEEARAALDELAEASENRDQIIISRFSDLSTRTYDRCYGQQWATAVGSDGKLYVCCEYKYNPRFLLGDLKEHTLEEIWKSEERKRTLEQLDVPSSCFLGCKLHQVNTVLSQLIGSPSDIERLLEANQDRTYPDVNFI